MSSETIVNSSSSLNVAPSIKPQKRKRRAQPQAVERCTAHETLNISPSPTFLDWAHQTPSNRSIRKSISSSSLSSGAKSGRSAAQWDTEYSFVHGGSYTLQDTAALDTIESLLLQYGTASHMGARDWSYSFYINGSQTGALIYKVLDKVAMISGDPLCAPDQCVSLMREFQAHCKKQHLGVAMVAASDNMSKIAHQHKWMSIRFGSEKILNPCTNPMLLGRSGKRTVAKCRQLVKQGTTVDIYCPAEQYDAAVENKLVRIYKDWCAARNHESGATNAFMTVYDILSLPRLMAFVYSKDANGNINGFAALRKLGRGYHVDPFIAAADAPKGTSDVLLYATMALAKETGITKLSLGFEVVPELEDMERVPKVLHGVIKKTHRRIFGQLHLGGKKTFFDRFHPDEQQDAGLWILYPQRPSLKHMLATMHFANIRVRTVIS